MAVQATITLEVPALPDAGVWFANASAWANYWRGQIATVTVEGAETTLYTPLAYDDTLVPVYQQIDGVDYVLVTQAMFQSMQARYDNLEFSYQSLRTQLKDAGLIDTAQ